MAFPQIPYPWPLPNPFRTINRKTHRLTTIIAIGSATGLVMGSDLQETSDVREYASKLSQIRLSVLVGCAGASAYIPDLHRHIAKAGIRKPNATNNRIERLNGTLRERVKVQRGWKSYETPIAEGQRIHYNFVKPHAALEGKTPAERAGIGIEGKDKWLTLLRNALTTPRGTGA